MTIHTAVIQEVNSRNGVSEEPLVYAEFTEKALMLEILSGFIDTKIKNDEGLYETVYQYLPEDVNEATVDSLDDAMHAFLNERPDVFFAFAEHEARIKLPVMTWAEKPGPDGTPMKAHVDQGGMQYIEPNIGNTHVVYRDEAVAYNVVTELHDDGLLVGLAQGTAQGDNVRFGDMDGVVMLESSGEVDFI